MPVCFPYKARITEEKVQALTLSELEREGAMHVQAKNPKGFLAYVSMCMCIL